MIRTFSRQVDTTMIVRVEATGCINKKVFLSRTHFATSDADSGSQFIDTQESNDVEFLFTNTTYNAGYFITVFVDYGGGYGSAIEHIHKPEGPLRDGAGDLTVGSDNTIQFVLHNLIAKISVFRDYCFVNKNTIKFTERYDRVNINE